MAAHSFDRLPEDRRVTFGKAFGQRIHSLRQRAGLTQEQLAELADIDRSYIQRIEAGLRTPSVEIVIRLQKALKCGWDDLFRNL